MWFNGKLLKDARSGSLFLDCLDMELKGNTPEKPGYFRGPGYIKQGESGLEFKIYAKELENVDIRAMWTDPGPKAGELFRHEHYYSLFAVDNSGTRWTAGQIKPYPSHSSHPSPSSIVITGSIFELESRHEDDFVYQLNHLTIAVYESVTVPFNTTTNYLKSKGNEEPECFRTASEETEFRAAGCDFTVNMEDGVLLLSAKSAHPFPELLEARVIEALLFVLGRPVWWRESNRSTGNTSRLRLRSRIITPTPIRMKAPFYERFDSIYKNYWRLFALYLEFVVTYEQPEFHPCSAFLLSVSQASSNSAHGYALNLAVAVEGLVKHLHKDQRAKDPDYEKAVEAFKEHVASWPQLDYWANQGGPNRERLIGLTNILNQGSPQDHLYRLAKENKLIKNHVIIWKELRTQAAHSLDNPNSPQLQKLLRDIDTVIVLMYHLLFHVIGYQGPYVDFSTVGYPTRIYPPWRPQPVDSSIESVRAALANLASQVSEEEETSQNRPHP